MIPKTVITARTTISLLIEVWTECTVTGGGCCCGSIGEKTLGSSNLMQVRVSAARMMALKDLVPAAQNNINTQFILLDKSRPVMEGQQKTCLALVADETAAVHFLLWGDECDAFEPGDIVRLSKGIFSYNRNNLVLRAGKRGQTEKVGEFTMVFVETPNLSEIRWVPDASDPKKYVQESKSVTRSGYKNKVLPNVLTSTSLSLPSELVSGTCELSSDKDVSSAAAVVVDCTACQTAVAASASAAEASTSFSIEFLSRLSKVQVTLERCWEVNNRFNKNTRDQDHRAEPQATRGRGLRPPYTYIRRPTDAEAWRQRRMSSNEGSYSVCPLGLREEIQLTRLQRIKAHTVPEVSLPPQTKNMPSERELAVAYLPQECSERREREGREWVGITDAGGGGGGAAFNGSGTAEEDETRALSLSGSDGSESVTAARTGRVIVGIPKGV
ncbi:hypothetical protein RJ641_030430 [Dillenia turbinata]|uniref:Uncharacterized protein n=1 Tax=Dillenia turbinata TaxID=194707 RepID=A0AAN8VVE1_9MAGN